MIRNRMGILLLLLNLIALTVVGNYTYMVIEQTACIERQILVQSIAQKQIINDFKEEVINISKNQNLYNISQLEIDRNLLNSIEKIKIANSNLEKNSCQIDLPDIKNIKASNVLMINYTIGCLGSGTHIRIKNQDYILTAGHLIEDEKDIIYAQDANTGKYYLKLIKVDHNNDLALFRIEGGCPKLGTLEISDITPEAGACVTAIGNPGVDRDVITTGIICKIESQFYKVDNTCFFGNSGGALLYKGKIVGVCSQVDLKIKYPIIVIYTQFVKLSLINEFLKDFTERE